MFSTKNDSSNVFALKLIPFWSAIIACKFYLIGHCYGIMGSLSLQTFGSIIVFMQEESTGISEVLCILIPANLILDVLLISFDAPEKLSC